jgi:hypothetical protein
MNLVGKQLYLLRIRNVLLNVWLGQNFRVFDDASVYFSLIICNIVEELFDLNLPGTIGKLLSSFLVAREVGDWVLDIPKEWPEVYQKMCRVTTVFRQ